MALSWLIWRTPIKEARRPGHVHMKQTSWKAWSQRLSNQVPRKLPYRRRTILVFARWNIIERHYRYTRKNTYLAVCTDWNTILMDMLLYSFINPWRYIQSIYLPIWAEGFLRSHSLNGKRFLGEGQKDQRIILILKAVMELFKPSNH